MVISTKITDESTFLKKRVYVFTFRERKRGRETAMGEKNIVASGGPPPPPMWDLAGNPESIADLLVLCPAINPLSYTNQGYFMI